MDRNYVVVGVEIVGLLFYAVLSFAQDLPKQILNEVTYYPDKKAHTVFVEIPFEASLTITKRFNNSDEYYQVYISGKLPWQEGNRPEVGEIWNKYNSFHFDFLVPSVIVSVGLELNGKNLGRVWPEPGEDFRVSPYNSSFFENTFYANIMLSKEDGEELLKSIASGHNPHVQMNVLAKNPASLKLDQNRNGFDLQKQKWIVLVNVVKAAVIHPAPGGNSWLPFKFPLRKFNTIVNGFITDEGAVRITNESRTLSSEGQLLATDYKFGEEGVFEGNCDHSLLTPKAGDSIFSRKNTFKLEVPVFPFAKLYQKLIISTQIREGMKVVPSESIQNQPYISRFEVAINADQGSSSSKAKYDFSHISEGINQQLMDQTDKIQETGAATIDLSGLNNLACDLVRSKAHLIITARIIMQQPKPQVITPITAKDVALIYQELSYQRKIFNRDRDIHDNPGDLSAKHLFTSAVEKIYEGDHQNFHHSPYSGKWGTLYPFFNELFDSQSFTWKKLQPADFARISHILEDVATFVDYNIGISVNENIKLKLGRN